MSPDAWMPIAALGLVAAAVVYPFRRIEISLGVFTRRGDRYVEFKRTTNIPFRPDDPSFEFGLRFRPAFPRKMRIRLVHHLPSRPLTVPDSHSTQILEGPSGECIIRTGSAEYRGEGCIPFRFHAGDPLGVYRVEVFVNDKLRETIEYKVLDASAV